MRLRFIPFLLLFCAQLQGHAAVQWRDHDGYRFASVEPAGTGRPGFSMLPSSQTGVTFTNHLAEAAVAQNRIFENGSGVALGDVDGDGWCDLYFAGWKKCLSQQGCCNLRIHRGSNVPTNTQREQSWRTSTVMTILICSSFDWQRGVTVRERRKALFTEARSGLCGGSEARRWSWGTSKAMVLDLYGELSTTTYKDAPRRQSRGFS
jgi:hypothetical protein